MAENKDENDKKVQEQLTLINILEKLKYLEEGMKVIKSDLETLAKVVEEKEEKKDTPQPSKPSYSVRDINVCDNENFFICVVCESRPSFIHKLTLRTCSIDCSAIVENTILKQTTKKK